MGLHVGIIMDGNGRWAQARGLMRTQGHLEGLKAAKQVVKTAASGMGIDFLTLYVFSTENWKRTAEEVGFIMGLVRQYLKAEFAFASENHIRVRHAGDLSRLPPDVAGDIADVCRDTESFAGMQVILALNYGGRDEIVRAVNKALASASASVSASASASVSASGCGVSGKEIKINETIIAGHLDNPDIPDPDLIIRTAGEYRTSNFLLWEAAYAEYYISDKLWPDWTGADLVEAIESFQKRERRFGGVNSASHEAGVSL